MNANRSGGGGGGRRSALAVADIVGVLAAIVGLWVLLGYIAALIWRLAV